MFVWHHALGAILCSLPTKRTVFKYKFSDKHLHYFEAIDGSAAIFKKDSELGQNGFRPFCIDHVRIEKWLEGEKK